MNVIEAAKASTYDLVNNEVVLFQKGAVEVIEKTLTA